MMHITSAPPGATSPSITTVLPHSAEPAQRRPKRRRVPYYHCHDPRQLDFADLDPTFNDPDVIQRRGR
jgi:hypothetical protein